MHLEYEFDAQQFSNGYELVNGAAMHAEYGGRFHIAADVVKRHVRPGHFVKLMIDSPRFSVQADASEKREIRNPILPHHDPASLVPVPNQGLPSRGWGEEFWVQVTERAGEFLNGIVDNPLAEARLHGLDQGDEIVFQEDHILTLHPTHSPEIWTVMDDDELTEALEWFASQEL